MKVCSKCRLQKSLTEFNTRTVKGSIFPRPECRECQNEASSKRQKRWYVANRERKIADVLRRRKGGAE